MTDTSALPRRTDRPEYPLVGRTRWLAAAVFVAGGLLETLSFLLESGDLDAPARIAWWLAHPLRTQLAQASGLLAIACLVGTFWFAYPLLRAGSRRLSGVAVTLLMTAMVGLAAVQGIELAAYWAAAGGHADAAAGILTADDPGLAGAVGFVMFLPAAVLGNLLAAVAMWRSRFVPRVVVVVVLAFTVLDFGAGLGVLSHAVDLVTGVVLAWAVVTGYVRRPRRAASDGIAAEPASAGAQ